MTDCVPIDLAWYDGLDHREIGALALLLHHAGSSAWPGCLPDDDVLLCDCAGFGVQLRAWRRLRPAVLAGWRRVRHASGAVLWAHAGLCAALAVAAGVEAAALEAVPVHGAAPELTARERAAQRDMIKKRRKRARERGAAGYEDADGRFVRFADHSAAEGLAAAESLSPSAATVPLRTGGQSPSLSPGLSPRQGRESAGFSAQDARARAPAREESPLGGSVSPGLSPGDGGQARAGARGESGSAESHPADRSFNQTTTQSGQALASVHGRAYEGAGAREADATGGRQQQGDTAPSEAADGSAAEAKAARQGEPAPLSGAALDQACARVYADWLAERSKTFPQAAPPTKPRSDQLGIIRQWFDAGASEDTLRRTIRLQMRTLKGAAPNTIWVFHLSMAGAITEQLSLPLLQQQGNALRLRPSLLRHAQALIAAVPSVAALNSWIGRCELEPLGEGRVRLVAPTGFIRSTVIGEYRDALDAVFGAGRWQVDAAGQQKRQSHTRHAHIRQAEGAA